MRSLNDLPDRPSGPRRRRLSRSAQRSRGQQRPTPAGHHADGWSHQVGQADRIRKYCVTPAIRRSMKWTAAGAACNSGSVTKLRLDEPDDPASGLERAVAGGEDVLHPLRVRPVGEEEEVGIALVEHVDRRAVNASGLAARVGHDAEVRQSARERAQDRIEVAGGDTSKTATGGSDRPSCRRRRPPSAR